MSVALYRKYRSPRFADLVGQEHAATTLRSEVRDGTFAHAYLLAGIRGTGKTSAARILARAVNCLDTQDGEPCNECAPCVEILGGGAVDVLEIDAASNRGIDEMRDLREKVKFLPASLRRKVYIVDEAHMLTPEAWNAFLKTLEEPPPHVLFILATTEPHKVPDTVRSRVQRFDLRRVPTALVAQHLADVARREGAEVEPEAAALLAAAAQGSMRDGLSLLDHALAGGERPLRVEAARRALGLADPDLMRRMLISLGAGDAGGALRACAEAFDTGAEARQLLREMGRLARASQLVALGEAGSAEVVGDEAALCRDLAVLARPGFWVDVLDRASEAEINLRQPVDARLQVELCLFRLAAAATADPGAPGAGAAADLARRVAALETELRSLRREPAPAVDACQAAGSVGAGGASGLLAPGASPASRRTGTAAGLGLTGSGSSVTAVPRRPTPATPLGSRPAQRAEPPAHEPGVATVAPPADAEPASHGPPPAAAPLVETGDPPAAAPQAAEPAAAGPIAAQSTGSRPAGLELPSASPATQGPSAAQSASGPDPAGAGAPVPGPFEAATRPPGAAAAGGDAHATDLAGWRERWPLLIEAVRRRDVMLAGLLHDCRPIAVTDGRLTIAARFGFHLEQVRDPVRSRILTEVASELAGGPWSVDAVFDDSGGSPGGQPGAGAAATADVDATAAALAAFPGSTVVGQRLRDPSVDSG